MSDNVLVGNSFPMSLIRREVRIQPVEISVFRDALMAAKHIHSFWGHSKHTGSGIEHSRGGFDTAYTTPSHRGRDDYRYDCSLAGAEDGVDIEDLSKGEN